MTDNKLSSGISDPRADLEKFSNRQESSFQYGDPSKVITKVIIVEKHMNSVHYLSYEFRALGNQLVEIEKYHHLNLFIPLIRTMQMKYNCIHQSMFIMERICFSCLI